MKTPTMILTCLLTAALLVSCGGEPEPDAHAGQDHDGRAHAQPRTAAADVERCAAHGATADLCFLCDPELREEGRLWCAGHDRYEDRCWDCQPQLRDPDRAYCDQHGLYEDECHLCDPSRRAVAAGASTGGLYCVEHDMAESSCGICHPELAATLEPGGEVLVRLPSARSAELAGVAHGSARAGRAAGYASGYVEVDYDRNRLVQVTPRAEGIVARVLVDVGDEVVAGDPLVVIASTQLAAAKQSFLDARLELDLRAQELERARRLREQEIGSERQLQEATAAHKRAAARAAAAGQNLRNLGLDDEAVARVASAGDTSAELTVRAPFAGEVIERDAVLGESVAADAPLMRVADLSRMWLELSLPQSALAMVREGLPVVARFDALPDREVTGRLVWVASGLDERSRLLRARAEVPNPDGRLKAGLYGRAEVALDGDGFALSLPRQAIRDLDQRPFVLVRRDADLYALRRVALGPRHGESVAVLAGLSPDETVVTGGGFAVFSELLKSRFGAGCAEE
ncbi:efflux RND transporter periplasmic adaptor subunit [bacterium]|nr:efflux RND transporter periplasmic adaptor subunit [bacterium]